MSKLDDILDEAVKPKLKREVKALMLELIEESMPEGSYHVNTEALQRKVEEL